MGNHIQFIPGRTAVALIKSLLFSTARCVWPPAIANPYMSLRQQLYTSVHKTTMRPPRLSTANAITLPCWFASKCAVLVIVADDGSFGLFFFGLFFLNGNYASALSSGATRCIFLPAKKHSGLHPLTISCSLIVSLSRHDHVAQFHRHDRCGHG